MAGELQQSIARIHQACKAPPLSPPEYRALFAIMAQEIGENQLQGVKTLDNVAKSAAEIGISLRSDDARFVLDAISDADPWFEQGVSPALFATRFRNFVVARCQEQGLSLSASELDLIDAWFAGAPRPETAGKAPPAPSAEPMVEDTAAGDWNRPHETAGAGVEASGGGQIPMAAGMGGEQAAEAAGEQDDFPRIVRNRLRG